MFTTVLSQTISSAKHVYELPECRLIRQHVDRQAGVFQSTASVVNNSRSVCQLWAEPGLHTPSKHVEPDHGATYRDTPTHACTGCSIICQVTTFKAEFHFSCSASRQYEEFETLSSTTFKTRRSQTQEFFPAIPNN